MSTWSFTLDHGGDITALVDVNSINRTVRLHTDLKPNVNKLSFRVRYDSTLFGNLLSYDPIEIQVDKDSTPYFTGFLSPNYRAQIRDGQRYIDLIAEDPTLQTLGVIIAEPWNAAGFAVCTPSATSTSLVHAICTEAGVTLAAGAPTISSVVPYVVVLPEEKNTWGNLLAAILFEYGYGYGFDPDGTLAIYQLVNSGTVTTTGTLTTAAGTANIRGEVLIEKTPERYDDIRVAYDLVELKTGIVVFQDADEITMAAAGDAGGADYYPLTSKIGEVYSAWKSPDGYTIWVVTSGTLSATLESGISLVSALQNYYKKASFAYQNTTAGTRKITGLKITGNAYVVASKNVVRSSATGGKLLMEHKAQYIFADAAAQALAEKLGQYYRYADIKYTVRSATEFTLGQYVTVADAIYAGISTKCRVVGITQKEAPTVIYEYALEGVDDFVAISTITEGGHDGTPTSGNFGDSDYYLNTPPSANVTSLAISSEPNPNGNEDVTFEFDYTQGTVPADGFLIFTKQAITTPGSIDINTDRAHFVPVGADGAYSVTLTLPTRQAGAGTIPLHYRFGVVSFGTRRAGTVVHAAGPVEASGWIDVTFVSELTDMPIRSYNGEGVNRRAIQIDNEALDWIDTPLTDPPTDELLRARIGRLGVGPAILMDGEFYAPCTLSWSSETLINAAGSLYQNIIKQSDGTFRVVYTRDSDSYLVQRTSADGITWSAESVINAGLSYFAKVIQQSDGTFRVFYSLSIGNLVQRTSADGITWSAESTINAAASSYASPIQQSDGTFRVVYTRDSDSYLVQRTSADGVTWSAESVINAATAYYPSTIQQPNKSLRVIYKRFSDNYLVQRTSADGITWSAESVINAANSLYPTATQQLNEYFIVLYIRDSDSYLVQRTSADGVTWSAESVVNAAQSNSPSVAQQDNGTLRVVYRRALDGFLAQRTLQRYAQLGAGIVESGSNANGSYIKFSDGTLVQFGYISSYNSLATGTGGWKLINMPVLTTQRISATANPTNWVGVSTHMLDSASTSQQIQVFNRGGYAGDTGIHWSFHGRWK